MAKQERTARRIYNGLSLEYWFKRFLKHDWERDFTARELEWGREIYRSGAIRMIELEGQDAAIHVQLQQEADPYYVVINWTGNQLKIRGSIIQVDRVRALGVAGLYEIEELVAHEISAVPRKSPDRKEGASSEEGVPVEPSMDPMSGEQKEGKRRTLALQLMLTEEGLELCPSWISPEGKRILAFSCNRNGNIRWNRHERLEWIRLIGLAQESHFRFRSDKKRYVLSDPQRISYFIREKLSRWEQRFTLEKDPSIRPLEKGVQKVEATAQAMVTQEGRVQLRWRLRRGAHWLTDAETHKVLNQRGKDQSVVLLPQSGIVTLPAAAAAVMETWAPAQAHWGAEGLPRYMLFSLFVAQDAIRIALSAELERWRDSLCDEAYLQKKEEKPQQRLYAGLRPYQREGVLWLRRLCTHDCHPLLADEMGLGKTLQVLALMNAWPVSDCPNLIVCPASVVPVWRSEVRKFFPKMETAVLKSGYDFQSHRSKSCLWIASYTQLRRHKALLEQVTFGYAVLDEAQFIKNPEAKVTLACLNIQAQHRLALTGTPVENRYSDLWALFRFLMPGLLGGRRSFEAALQKDTTTFTDRLRRQIAPFVLRRTKSAVLSELPEKVEMILNCPLSAIQRQEYSRLTQEALARWEDNLQGEQMRRDTLHVFALLSRLRQICCDPGLLPWRPVDWRHSGKLVALIDKLGPVLADGAKVVIFSQFVTLLQRVSEALGTQFPDVPVYTLTGSTADRAAPVAAFQRRKGNGIFLASLRAGGVGLNLNTADYAFLLDPWWNPAVEDQAVDRLHRIGRRGTVFVYRLLTEGTVEERIQGLKSQKKALFETTVGSLESLGGLRRHFKTLSELIELR